MLERLVGLPEVSVIGLHATDDHVELHIESVSGTPGVRGLRCLGPTERLAGGRTHRPAVRRQGDGTALAQAALALCGPGLPERELDRAGREDRPPPDEADPPGHAASDRRCRSQGRRTGSTRLPPSSAVTGTRSTTPLSSTARCSSTTLAASLRFSSRPRRDRLRPHRALLPHRLRHLDRRRRARSTARPRPRTWWRGAPAMADEPEPALARRRRRATLDLSGAYKAVFDAVLPDAHLGRRQVPRDQAGQRAGRRDEEAGPK